jgi:hypothetical protein
MIEVTSVTIPITAINVVQATGQFDRVDLANRLVTLANQAFTAAHTSSAAQCATTTGPFNLLGLCVPGGAFPNFAGFADTANTLIAEKPAVSARIAAMRFTGVAGGVTAVVSGSFVVQSLIITTIPVDHMPALERDAPRRRCRHRQGDPGPHHPAAEGGDDWPLPVRARQPAHR